ncbi:hypothetical protein [Pseudoxanthomonas indica]|uniref:Uncharacterized protein n=1 Tax=Pseudoxanthomonas indica TaxID=428993 RepID=A0A1T5K009_9GAMM|nr:hypothetical protein [Pseudoxanthomonas indica]GGD45644.1 hypothetical protein GCM10007235_16950 [Pseudoxanthomonas indica]SKC56976.1 hypothetical protein SAMN06296058_1236 [Pseudoxanthomonas indica]
MHATLHPKSDALLDILSVRLGEIRETYPLEDVYQVFAGEVRARTYGLTPEEERQVRLGAEALQMTSGL